MKLACLIPCLALLAACQSAPRVFDPNDEARRLFSADVAFARLAERTDPKTAFAAYMAPDGMLLPRGSESAIEGYDRVIGWFGDGAPGYRLFWTPKMAEVSAAGDLGWTWGRYQVVVDSVQVSTGKYVKIWKKQPDGSWKVRLEMGNQRPAREPGE